ncbi:MAG: hypothetical protein Kow0049_04170 [Stanieria sp.]|jgi:hypothetical protein
MENLEALIKTCQKQLTEGSDIEEILNYLRKTGCSKSRCIAILLKLNYLPPNKAQYTKYVVHFSKTWEDMRETHEEWHDKILEVLNRAKIQ